MTYMLRDPGDPDMALRTADLRLMHRTIREGGTVEWVPLDEIRKASNHPDDDFTRPAW